MSLLFRVASRYRQMNRTRPIVVVLDSVDLLQVLSTTPLVRPMESAMIPRRMSSGHTEKNAPQKVELDGPPERNLKRSSWELDKPRSETDRLRRTGAILPANIPPHGSKS